MEELRVWLVLAETQVPVPKHVPLHEAVAHVLLVYQERLLRVTQAFETLNIVHREVCRNAETIIRQLVEKAKVQPPTASDN